MAEMRFIRKLWIERCLECTRSAVFLSRSLMISMTYRLRSITLSYSGISLFFMLDLSPVTMCVPFSNRNSKSFVEMYPLKGLLSLAAGQHFFYFLDGFHNFGCKINHCA